MSSARIAGLALAITVSLNAVVAVGEPAGLPALEQIPASLTINRAALVRERQRIEDDLKRFQSDGAAFNAKPAEQQTDREFEELQARQQKYIDEAIAFNKKLRATIAAAKSSVLGESDYFYALQTRTLSPLDDGGHPIDKSGPPKGLRGLVGGTTWTFGFKWPKKACDGPCRRQIEEQLKLFCSSQAAPQACMDAGLPFTQENYDLVVSMGSAHTPLHDLAARAIWDGSTFGEYSRQNKEIFASLKNRDFTTLDCHSNGAMLCLAALRSGDTTAQTVRLFGPQINPDAAARWREWSRTTGGKVEIYINHNDPVPAAAWKQPTPQTAMGKAATAAWFSNPVTAPAAVADALMYVRMDGKSAVLDKQLGEYGFAVKRFKPAPASGCGSTPALACHSMRLYEESAAQDGR